MTVNAITDTKKGRTGIAPTYLHTTQNFDDTIIRFHRIHECDAVTDTQTDKHRMTANAARQKLSLLKLKKQINK